MSKSNINIPAKNGQLLKSLGIETLGSMMTPIIKIGEELPSQASQVFSTAEDNQSAVTVHVLMGTAKKEPKNKWDRFFSLTPQELAKDCESLGEFNITGIDRAPRGVPQIEVTFKVDKNGNLTVTAQEKKSSSKPYKIKFQNSEKKDSDNSPKINSSGTCFLINNQGIVLTNSHVVGNNKQMTVIREGEEYTAKLMARDDVNDLAILKTKIKNKAHFPLSTSDAKRIDKITAIGFGFGKRFSSDVKVTSGIVSSLAGVANNYSHFQIDASIQVGNSGGPVLDKSNSVVGIIVSKLNTETAYRESGTIAENVNFAIKISTAKQFLDSNDIAYKSNNADIKKNNINKIIDSSVLFIHD
jgi:S1-C subfamily serine protease